mgnify:CR=1 FL=1
MMRSTGSTIRCTSIGAVMPPIVTMLLSMAVEVAAPLWSVKLKASGVVSVGVGVGVVLQRPGVQRQQRQAVGEHVVHLTGDTGTLGHQALLFDHATGFGRQIGKSVV